MLYGQTGKYKRSKNKRHELRERISKVCFQNSPAESSYASPPSLSLSLSLLSLPYILSLPPETKCLKGGGKKNRIETIFAN